MRSPFALPGIFLCADGVDEVCEIRFEVPTPEVSVLDGYCSATGKSRTDVMRDLLKQWSSAKRREAILICRVANINPAAPDEHRQ